MNASLPAATRPLRRAGSSPTRQPLLEAAWAALTARVPEEKCAQVAALPVPDDDFRPQPASCDWSTVPGRPDAPRLVPPRQVPHRGLGTAEGRAALVHAVAHIEFNAINLALDAMLRFSDMPAAYYRDWLRVAQDEARHFGWLTSRLAQLGCAYGNLPAHNGLWEAAEKTAHDPLVRMACVPRVLEARGLDVTPGMIAKLEQAGDGVTAAILHDILREEVVHVAIGTQWYRWLCVQRGVDPDERFPALLAEYDMHLKAPFNWPARDAAGFTEVEMAAWRN